MTSSPRITTGTFSQMTRLTPKALRIYEKKELLVPVRDQFTGYRYYSTAQIELGIKIKMLATMGFGIDEIRNILDAAYGDDDIYLQTVFSKKLNEIQLEIERLRQIEDIISSKKPMELIFMNISEPVIKELAQARVLSKREKGTYGQTIGKLIAELMAEISTSADLRISGPITFVCHDEHFVEKDADIEVAIPISGRISIAREDMEVRNLEGGSMLSVIYTGPYDDIGNAYTRLHQHIIDHGYTVNGKFREIYLNSPQEVPSAELLTELMIPVVKEEA